MSKCGKGCMPECEYFTTGGCISPFNCPYKIEVAYNNSATTIPYTTIEEYYRNTIKQRAEEMRLANEERKQVVREFLKLLKEKESPKLLMWEYGEGYLDCIKTAEELAAQYGVEVEE